MKLLTLLLLLLYTSYCILYAIYWALTMCQGMWWAFLIYYFILSSQQPPNEGILILILHNKKLIFKESKQPSPGDTLLNQSLPLNLHFETSCNIVSQAWKAKKFLLNRFLVIEVGNFRAGILPYYYSNLRKSSWRALSRAWRGSATLHSQVLELKSKQVPCTSRPPTLCWKSWALAMKAKGNILASACVFVFSEL